MASNDSTIVAAFKAFTVKVAQRAARPAIAELESQIKGHIAQFKLNSRDLISIGNQQKAQRIEQAYDRAKQNAQAKCSVEAFLNYRAVGKESIKDAFGFQRIGFFAKPNSAEAIDTFVQEHAPKRQ